MNGFTREKQKTTQSTDSSSACYVIVYPPVIQNFIYKNLELNFYCKSESIYLYSNWNGGWITKDMCFDSWQGNRFFSVLPNKLNVVSPPILRCSNYRRHFLKMLSGLGLKMSTSVHLVSRLRMTEAKSLLLHVF